MVDLLNKDMKDLTDRKFGRLTVLNLSNERQSGKITWECKCSCGNITNVQSCHLMSRHTKSCGCLQKEITLKNIKKYHYHIKENHIRGGRWNGVGDLYGTYFESLRSGAKTRELEFGISKEYLWELFLKQNKRCNLSGIELTMPGWKKIKGTASVDRIDSSKGYIEGNIQWIHKDVNRMKMALPQNRFIDLCKLIAGGLEKKVGFLYNTRVYLGGNIENTDDFIGWRDEISQELEKLSIVCFNPIKDVFVRSFGENEKMKQTMKKWRGENKFDELQKVMKKIVSKDLRMVDICDFAIFKIEPERPSFGTVHELVNCALDRKPILILIKDKHTLPLWFLRYIDMNLVFESKDMLISFLNRVNDGKEKLDDKFWKILQPEYRLGLTSTKRKIPDELVNLVEK